jgi:cytosine/creatinine deaminase
MKRGFFSPPTARRYALRGVRAPGCLVKGAFAARGDGLADIDIVIDDGVVASVETALSTPAELGPDLGAAIVWPGFVDIHTHLDKGHIWPRAANPDGTTRGAIPTVGADRRANWSAEDVRRRMEFGIATAYAHGVVAIRTHIDTWAPQGSISFPVFDETRSRWAGRMILQATSLQGIDIFLTEDGTALANLVARYGGNLGCATRFSTQTSAEIPDDFDAALDRLFTLAIERGLDLDLHVDESNETSAATLIRVARAAHRRRFTGTILCGHCCSLALQPAPFVEETLTACADAGIDVVSLPMCNLYLQGRGPGVTPRWRGVTLLHEMKARGMRVAVAGDNNRDPFYAYGDHDMLETYNQAVRILQLDHPFDDWAKTATATPAAIMKLPLTGLIQTGSRADLVVLKARSYSEMLSRAQSDRVVIRGGKAIDAALPDYSQLDDLVGPP